MKGRMKGMDREEMMAKVKGRMSAARDRAKAGRGSGIADTGPGNIPPRRPPMQKLPDGPLPPGLAKKYDRMKERFPGYSFGAAPTTMEQFRDMRRGLREWRKTQPKPGAPTPGMKPGDIKTRIYERIEQAREKKLADEAAKGANKKSFGNFAGEKLKAFRAKVASGEIKLPLKKSASSATRPTPSAPVPPATPSQPAMPKVMPKSNKWEDIVSAYFPENSGQPRMKAGGMVRGGGCVQRGKTKGKMV